MTCQVSANAGHCCVFYVTRVDRVCPVRTITSSAYCKIAGEVGLHRTKLRLAPLLMIQVFWDLTLYCLASIAWRFKGSPCLHLQGTAVQEEQPPSRPASVWRSIFLRGCISRTAWLGISRRKKHRHIPEELNVQEHRYENLKSRTTPLFCFEFRVGKDKVYLRLVLYSVRLKSHRK
jgi:hypothetical protein